jgi:ABC-type glycerol-3-phosphate transport system permease component
MLRVQRMQPFSLTGLLTMAATVAGLATLGFYVAIIVSESDDSAAEVAPWIFLMSTATLMPVVTLFSRTRAVVAGCLIGCAVIWSFLVAISLFIVAVPAILLPVFAYANYHKSSKKRHSNVDVGAVG